MAGVRVTFDGTPAPIVYARLDQVGVIVPFEVAGKAQVAVLASNAGLTSAVFQQAIGASSPAVFTAASTGSGQGSVVNQEGTLNGPSSAAPKGSIVSIYMTGAGQMIPAGRTGAVGTASHAIAASVAVKIGGQDARVTYAGAAPFAVQGVYQVNAVVPQTASSGSVSLEVSVGGTASQSAVLMHVQ
jgi:uncharacterized protein (TIGR03437 family)